MELICSADNNEIICLKFYPCFNLGSDISWEKWHEKEPLVVLKTDYEKLLLDHFNSVFPLVDPISGEIQEYFDVCFDNWIGKKDWNRLIENIRNNSCSLSDRQVVNFYQAFIGWCETQLEWANMIVVEGNL